MALPNLPFVIQLDLMSPFPGDLDTAGLHTFYRYGAFELFASEVFGESWLSKLAGRNSMRKSPTLAAKHHLP